ncbi:37S ribosomal protein s16 [Grosmannia clavigera kw1407]|uniref:37S ribosomal protein s16 n=1 Tax=Grosmannia clavigera (strain kw1407 / UAMH 11150) TaxID=655863 RepID=F0XK98_GROCL|nr:37S ribosomal protein s16 [Grosmannia clavigera kw1407]EFX01996.1 37S ribosomal protein s16 [Grosmannia clavigera kw1407]
MVVKIRLARFGRTNSPFFNIVVAQARSAQRGRPMEVLGTYNSRPERDPYEEASGRRGTAGKAHKDVQLDVTRTKYWIGVGAQPTDTVWRILSMVGILEPKQRANADKTGTTAQKA